MMILLFIVLFQKQTERYYSGRERERERERERDGEKKDDEKEISLGGKCEMLTSLRI